MYLAPLLAPLREKYPHFTFLIHSTKDADQIIAHLDTSVATLVFEHLNTELINLRILKLFHIQQAQALYSTHYTLSHSNKNSYALSVISSEQDQSLGIDLEVLDSEQNWQPFYRYFFNEFDLKIIIKLQNEIIMMHKNFNTEALLFSAKEALLKATNLQIEPQITQFELLNFDFKSEIKNLTLKEIKTNLNLCLYFNSNFVIALAQN